MIFKIVLSNRFKKDLKIAKKRGLDLDQLKIVVNKLANGEKLEKKYRDHGLVGDYAGSAVTREKPRGSPVIAR